MEKDHVMQLPLSPLPERPLFSIVVPSFNQGDFIRETLRSVLLQEYRPLEIIVMDGGSTDGTLDVLRELDSCEEIRWWSRPDGGVAEAVNNGFQEARGEIIGIQSSDDLYLPGALSLIERSFRETPDVGLIYGDVVYIDVEGAETWRGRSEQFSIENFLSKRTLISQSSTFFRRDLLAGLEGWDARYFNADTEFWLRAIFRTSVRKVDEYLSQRRIHPGQRNVNGATIIESYWRMMRDSPDLARLSFRHLRASWCGRLLHLAHYGAYLGPGRRKMLRMMASLIYPPIRHSRKGLRAEALRPAPRHHS